MTAERFASNVAFATEVSLIDQCQKERSPVKLRPTARSAMACGLSGRVVRARRDNNAQIQSAGAASATRQNADVMGPTSARRTKIGEKPIAVAPRISAAKLSVVRFGSDEAGMMAGEDSMAAAECHSPRKLYSPPVSFLLRMQAGSVYRSDAVQFWPDTLI